MAPSFGEVVGRVKYILSTGCFGNAIPILVIRMGDPSTILFGWLSHGKKVTHIHQTIAHLPSVQ